MGGKNSRQTPEPAPPVDDVPHTEPTPALVVAKHSRTLTAWLDKVAALRRSGIPYRQPLEEGAISYFELNFDIVHNVLSFLQPKDLTRVACVSKYFQTQADDNTYWHAFFARKTKPCRVPREYLGNWKKLYQEANEAPSLQELLGTLTTGATITVPPGIYPPMTFGAAAVTTNGAAEQLLQLVGVPRPGEPVVFETTSAVGLISVFGAASLHNITVRHRYVRAAEDRSALCAIYVRGTLTLDNCDISAGAKAVYGVYGAEKSTVTVRNCRFHELLGPAVVAWHGSKTTIENCTIEETDGVEVTEDCELTIRDTVVRKLRNDGIQLRARSIGKIERCKLSEGGGQGVHSMAKEVTVIDCDISQFPFSGVRSNENAGTVVVTDCRIQECATGVLIDTGTTAKVTSTCIKQCTTAIEIGDGGVVSASTCTLLNNQCGVAVSGPGALVTLRECIVRKNLVGVRVAVEAKADIVGCDIRESKKYGVHVTCFEGEGTTHLEETYCSNNDIALSGTRNVFVDQLPKIEEEKTENGEHLSREVRAALQRGVCTFQLTGTHYRLQKAWHCISCKLVDSRGMCDVCRRTCHADHEVVCDGVSQFFCDCGSEGFCEVYARNKRALGSSQSEP